MSARPWYAVNARDLLANRREGMAPDGPVVVSLVGGDFPEAAAALYVHEDMPLARMDWRMLVGLEVWVWSDRSAPLERLLQVLDGVARARPRRLVLRFAHSLRFTRSSGELDQVDVHDIEVGMGIHTEAIREIPAQHVFIWSPANTAHTWIGARLTRELVGKNGHWTEL